MAATKSEADGQHPPGHYLVVEDAEKPSTWHLRVRGMDGKPDHHLMGGAWAALHGGYRGSKYEGPNKDAALLKLKDLYGAEKMDLPSQTASDATNGKPALTLEDLYASGMMERPSKPSSKRSVAYRLLADLSFDRIRDLVNEELSRYFPSNDDGFCLARVTDLYPGYAIIEHGGHQFRMEYSVQGKEIKTEKPEEVETKFEPTSEIGTARQALMGEVEKYAIEHSCPVGIAMAEVTRLKPELWERYSRRVLRNA